MIFSIASILIPWMDCVFPLLVKLLVYSTVILVSGLTLERLLRKTGAVYKSFVLQMTLAAMLLLSVAALIPGKPSIVVFSLPSPSSNIDRMLNKKERIAVVSKESKLGIPVVKSANKEIIKSLNFDNQKTSPTYSRKNNSENIETEQSSKRKHLTVNLRLHGLLYIVVYISFTALWFMFSLYFLIRLLAGSFFVLYLRYYSKPAEPRLLDLCHEIADEIGIKPPRVFRSKIVKRTLLFGLFRPYILLPVWNFTDTMATQEVFLHELGHLKRRDNMWNIICQATKIIIPIQPLLGVLISRITDLSDYVCDDYVVRHIPDKRAYAEQLLHMADTIQNGQYGFAGGLGIAEKKTQLRKRIERIMSRSHAPEISLRFAQALPVLILLVFPSTVTGFVDFATGGGLLDEYVHGFPEYMIIEPKKLLNPDRDVEVRKTLRTEKESETVTFRELPGVIIEPVKLPHEKISNKSVEVSSIPEQQAASERKSEIVHAAVVENDPLEIDDMFDIEEEDDDADDFDDFANIETVQEAETASTSEDSVNVAYVTFFPAVKTSNVSYPKYDPFASLGENESIIVDVTFDKEVAMTSAEEAAYKWAKQSQENPIWSPDGSKIAFTGQSGEGLWLVSAAGGEARLIHENKHVYEYDGVSHTKSGSLTAIAFSPDGSEIYFHDWTPDEYSHIAHGRCNNPKIKAVTIKTGDVRVLVEKAHVNACFTQDGRYCIYLKKTGDGSRDWGGIYVKDLVTGDERSLGIDEGAYVNCLSPDGKAVMFSSSSDNPNQLYQVPLDGGQLAKITDFTSYDEYYCPLWPNYSPDGKWLYFLATYRDWWDSSGFYQNQKVNYMGICRMVLETGQVQRLTPNTDYAIRSAPQLSPDGNLIVYQAGQSSEGQGFTSQIIIMKTSYSDSGNYSAKIASVAPQKLDILGNFPNPFNMETVIRYTLPQPGNADIEIFNTLGQKVRDELFTHMSPGENRYVWDGKNNAGIPVSSGVYLTRLKMEGRVATHRMTLAK